MTRHEQFGEKRIEVSDSWAVSVTDDLEKSRRLAWRVAIGSLAISLMLSACLVILLPLKTVEPYTLLVDRQTGYVEALAPLDPRSISPDMALTRSLLAQYVISRESFYADSVREDYRKVSLWSADRERRRYQASLATTNPSSPLNTMPRGAVVRVTIRGISFLQDNTALVRFTTQREQESGNSEPPEYWAAILTFGFTSAEMSQDDRLLNPLGFQIDRYRRDAEAPPQDPALSERNAPPMTSSRGLSGPGSAAPGFERPVLTR